MPYRALTHNRVKHPINGKDGNTFVSQTNAQASAINSQNGVSNSGSPQVMRNKLLIMPSITINLSRKLYYDYKFYKFFNGSKCLWCRNKSY